jgi:hypothetical protein
VANMRLTKTILNVLVDIDNRTVIDTNIDDRVPKSRLSINENPLVDIDNRTIIEAGYRSNAECALKGRKVLAHRLG